MTLDEALAKASVLVDEHFDETLHNAELMLKEHGATAEELEAALTWHREALAEARAQSLAAVRAFYYTGSETIH